MILDFEQIIPYWSGSFRQTAQALTAYRSDRSFPAFFNDDQDFDIPGQQPDMGNGEPDDGDPWGTWGGYYSWDAESIVDSASIWKATVYLNSSGDYPVDIPGFDSSMADISIRRPQQFNPPDSGSVSWEFRRLSDSRILQSGWEKVGKDGVVTIPDVTIYKEKCELMVTVIPTSISTPEFGILHVYPNPVLSITTIEFQMPGPGDARIEIHNFEGRLYYPARCGSQIFENPAQRRQYEKPSPHVHIRALSGTTQDTCPG